ncbi:PQQ-dependent sugar dehydrogenase [Catenovulum sp. 2E275]|uniref:PQQ-dependent sugar dehydrogenase n=1 Tax=Catenovulum sp. 2E275 TaxID=2980497 RepID=UPI0021D14E7E|nr:PQQ-dependent sugar dehydrogenase [Catenovulum sp. 2E275]MCU4674935.1 PQQ-dependent sugar dehydrogenase [Catenovulum sp. 2E275]
MKFKMPFLFTILAFNCHTTFAAGNVSEVFKQNCASCHGESLQGGLAKSLVDNQWQYGSSDKDILATIRNGVAEAGMPAWKALLSEEEMRGLVVYIREQAYQAQQQQASPTADNQNNELFKTQGYQLSLDTVMSFDGALWAAAYLPNGDILATEKRGKLWLIQNTDGQYIKTEIKGIPDVWYHSQAGLLDVAVHPNYPRQPWIYISYSEPTSAKGKNSKGGMTAIARGQIMDGKWQQHQQIYSADVKFHTAAGVHFGSRIVLNNGYVFFSIGDRGKMDLAQDLTQPNGKIHRLYYDGRIPQNNPFIKDKQALASIWSYGHRNPQGLALHPVTEAIWETEHGPRGGDEVNLIEKNKNYGWPVITYGINYNGQPITDKTEQEGMEQPKHYWIPSIATGGIEFYRGKTFAKWNNNLLVTGMAKQELRRLVIEEEKVVIDEVLVKNQGRVRDVAVSPSGEILVVINSLDQGAGRLVILKSL